VCPRCARWNLAPLEERWEAVEAAERLFHETADRARGADVALCRLADGTRLVRVGRAEASEVAAWRYGGELRRRWARRHGDGVGESVTDRARRMARAADRRVARVLAAVAGPVWAVLARMRASGVVCRVPACDSPTGAAIAVRRRPLDGAWLEAADDGPRLLVPTGWAGSSREPRGEDAVALEGDVARRVLRRAMVHVNRGGGSAARVQGAVDALARAGGSGAFLRRAAGRAAPLAGESREEALALEMALHDEAERRALDGDLRGWAAAWREAEEVAAIVDGPLTERPRGPRNRAGP
jgi:hypothetical protein